MPIHTIQPIYNENSKVLILGSFPSVKSREQQFFYGHPQNRFWRVVAGVLGCPVPQDIPEKKALLLEHGIAVWDVIGSCTITGSSDASIRDVVPNDISRILDAADIRQIFANGTKSYELYQKYIYPQTKREIVKLPSTSPANAAFSVERLQKAWQVIADAVSFAAEKMDKTDILLNKLKTDSLEYNHLETAGYSLEEKKNAIRSLMNIRMPRALSDELVSLQDEYLQEELESKGVVALSDIPTIKEQFGSKSPHAEKISLWQGDITRLQVGAIVNAANSQMLGCFVPCHRCIDNAIHSAAGMQLREECSRIMVRRRLKYGKSYEEPTGTATLTLSYNLPCDYVIHTVGPIVYNGLSDRLCQDLQNCYENVLSCCLEHKIKSVAFCCISTGEFHFPNDKAAEIAWRTVTAFLETHGDCMERIIFNVFKDSDLQIYKQILD